MTSWLILLVKQFIDIYKYVLICNTIFNIEYSRKKINEIVLLMIYIVLIYILLYPYILTIWIELNNILCICFLAILYRSKIFTTLKMIIIVILVNTMIEQIAILFISINNDNIHSLKFLLSNILRLIIVIVSMFILKQYKLMRQKDYNLLVLPFYVYMNIIFGVSSTIVPLFVVKMCRDFINKRLLISVTLIAYINIIVALVSIWLFIKNKNEKEKYYLESIMKDKTLKLQERYYQKLIENYSSIRKFKHDIKGHIKLITGLLNEGKYDKAAIYLDEMSVNISNKNNYSTNNIYISTILNSFDQTFKENNITFELSYYITRNLNMNSMDICSLFYNLLTNAVEANLKLDEDRYIKLFIADIKDNMIIKIVNPVNSDFDLSFINENRTSKQDKENHGFGLITINDIVDKYYGGIDYSVSSGALSIDITLLNVLCD